MAKRGIFILGQKWSVSDMAGRRILPYDKRLSRHVKYGIVIFLLLNCKYS